MKKHHVISALVVLLLAACGGGGESAAPTNPPTAPPVTPPTAPPATPPTTPPSTPQPSLVLSSPIVSVQAGLLDRVATPTSAELSVENLTESMPLFIHGTWSTSGLQSAQFSLNGSRVQVQLAFRKPFETLPGTYTDTVVVRVCRETPCVNQIAGSPKSITVNYTVSMPTTAPRMTVQQSNVVVAGFVIDPGSPASPTVDLNFSGVQGSAGDPVLYVPHIRLSSTSNAVVSAAYTQLDLTTGMNGRITIVPKAPASLGPGTYNDVVTVKACLDAGCINEVAGSPATISVSYTVSSSTSGPDGFAARTIVTTASDIVWDAGRQVFHVAIGSNASANANTVALFDPVTGVISAHVPVGNNPARLALSPDGQYLYVALRGTNAIQRLLLPSRTLDLTIPLTRSDGTPLYVKEMHVAPGLPHTIGVVRSGSTNPLGSEYDFVVYDDALMRPLTIGTSSPDQVTTFQWDSAAKIFGVNSRSSSGTAYQIAVGATGLQIAASQPGVTSFDNDAYLVNGRIYMQRGRVFDPLTFAQIGAFPLGVVSGSTVMTPDPSTGKAFVLMTGTMKSYDLATLAPLGSIWLPRADPVLLNTRVVRWGVDGLAVLNHLTDTPGILLINGAFVRP